MANITPGDARAGFEVFRNANGEISLEDLNQRLTKAGHAPVSDRMYRHYRHLSAAGFNRYISINRFDVARASEPYENLSSNSRYRYTRSATGVRVTFPRGRRLVEAYGTAEEIGETGLILAFDDLGTVKALKAEATRPRVGDELRIELLDPPQQFDARVIDIDKSGKKLVTIEVEFERLQSIAEFIGREPLPRARYSIQLVTEHEADFTVDFVGRQVYNLFELVEIARALVNEAADMSKQDRYAPIPHVYQLSMKSPLYTELGMPTIVASVLSISVAVLGVAAAYEKWRKKRLENNSLETENKVAEAKAALESATVEMGIEVVDALKASFVFAQPPKPEDFTNLRQLNSALRGLAEQEIDNAKVNKQK